MAVDFSKIKEDYDLLGVNENVSEEELKKIHRDLSKKYHPDINGSPKAAEKLKDINRAYDEIKEFRKNGGKIPADSSKSNTYQQSVNNNVNWYSQKDDLKVQRSKAQNKKKEVEGNLKKEQSEYNKVDFDYSFASKKFNDKYYALVTALSLILSLVKDYYDSKLNISSKSIVNRLFDKRLEKDQTKILDEEKDLLGYLKALTEIVKDSYENMDPAKEKELYISSQIMETLLNICRKETIELIKFMEDYHDNYLELVTQLISLSEKRAKQKIKVEQLKDILSSLTNKILELNRAIDSVGFDFDFEDIFKGSKRK